MKKDDFPTNEEIYNENNPAEVVNPFLVVSKRTNGDHLPTDLCIPKEREEEFDVMVKTAMRNTSSNVLDDFEEFSRHCINANELMYVAYIYGCNIGRGAAEMRNQLREKLTGDGGDSLGALLKMMRDSRVR